MRQLMILAVLAALLGLMAESTGTAQAAGGDLLWEDQFDKAGGGEAAAAIAVEKGRVFAAGADDGDFLVRAYDAKTGALLWEDRFDKAGGSDEAKAIVVEKGRVFAAGQGTNAAGNLDFLVRAYKAK